MTDDTASLLKQVRAARAAAEGDSNDAEIEALQFALEEALTMLGFDWNDLDKPRRVPQVVVIENPQEDPGWEVFDGPVEVSTMSSFPFSKWAGPDDAYEATDNYLQMLRDKTAAPAFLAWLPDWLQQELDTRERDFLVDWDSLTLVSKTMPAGVRAALTLDSTRRCLWMDETADTGQGFTPSIVTENEAGHSPLAANTPLGPWYLGRTYAIARQIIDEANAEVGISNREAMDIVVSSMNASNVFGR